MSEVLVEFDAIITAEDGSRWVPKASGREVSGGLWEGWVDFIPVDDTRDAVRSGTETTQPNRDDLMYWAQGLSVVYLEGALTRARAEPATEHRIQDSGHQPF